MEWALRGALLGEGARVLGALLERVGVGRRGEAVRCRCGRSMKSLGRRTRTLATVFGAVPYSRSLFRCPACGWTRFPGDEELGVAGTGRSPGVQRLVARFASKQSFDAAREDLREAAGITLSAKDVERTAGRLGREIREWGERERFGQRRRVEEGRAVGPDVETLYAEFDGTGVPMVPAAVEGRRGKQPDGTAKTREAKLGCVFTQTGLDAGGRPARDPNSTTFVGKIEDCASFGRRIHDEALRRGLDRAWRVVVLTDGAEWIRNQVETHFPGATHIIDFYHAREHVSRLARLLFAALPDQARAHEEHWAGLLRQGRAPDIVREARGRADRRKNADRDVQNEIGYLERNQDRMRYDQYEQQGLFIGSGVIEAGCRHVIGQRLKQSGMFWSERGANDMIALRCCIKSGRFEDFWEYRATAGPITLDAA